MKVIQSHTNTARIASAMGRAVARWLIASLLAASAVAAGTPATALFDFASHEPDELSLRRGEALTVLDPEAAGEEGWAFGRTADGRQGLLPLSYVRLEPSAARTEPARQHVEVTATGAAGGSSWPEPSGLPAGAPEQDPAVAEAMWRYRNRRAAYNGPAELLERWGVSLELEAAGLPLASDAGGAPCATQPRGFGQFARQHAPSAPDQAQGRLQPRPICSGRPAIPAFFPHRRRA
jgi:hypothetical protein